MPSAAGALQELRRYHQFLESERDALSAQIDAIASAISTLDGQRITPSPRRRAGRASSTRRASTPAGGAAPSKGGAGGYREGTLKFHIHAALSSAGGPVKLSDLVAAVRRAKASKSKSLPKKVSGALAEMAGVKRIGRGLYSLGANS